MSDPVIVGKSSAIKDLQAFINTVSKSEANVVILGETGVGKELAARAIHCGSCRKHKPFIKINCSNLSDTLLESELFGHKRGAFTGALFDRPGLLEEAQGGIFFFDEIGDITPYIQAKLLEVVEQKIIRRVGDNCFRSIDTRFIFATNKNLCNLVAKNIFRQDLFYRISVLSVYIPPLRERKIDIPLLADYFINRENLKCNTNMDLSPEAVMKMYAYAFPGNIRELENILIRACLLSSGDIIREENIIFVNGIMNNIKLGFPKYKLENIINILIDCNGNKSVAAKRLGISRVHLYRILKSFGSGYVV